jgi:hypothetical protein
LLRTATADVGHRFGGEYPTPLVGSKYTMLVATINKRHEIPIILITKVFDMLLNKHTG